LADLASLSNLPFEALLALKKDPQNPTLQSQNQTTSISSSGHPRKRKKEKG